MEIYGMNRNSLEEGVPPPHQKEHVQRSCGRREYHELEGRAM